MCPTVVEPTLKLMELVALFRLTPVVVEVCTVDPVIVPALMLLAFTEYSLVGLLRPSSPLIAELASFATLLKLINELLS
jgi:hypothetical protein